MNEAVTGTKRGITGSTLKIIAITAMFIDHIGAALLEPFLLRGYGSALGVEDFSILLDIHYVMRMIIGRIAFPIFCFLLVEGFSRTSNVYKYALRLFLFAIVSEVPFDLAFRDRWWDSSYQNVFFTLFIGLIVMVLSDLGRNAQWPEKLWPGKSGLRRGIALLLGAGILAAGMVLAQLLCTDYGAYGVMCIAVLYYFRYNRTLQLVAGTAAFIAGDMVLNGGTSELLAPLGFLAVLAYNGERGIRMKYVFYLFYPVHLFLLYVIRLVVL